MVEQEEIISVVSGSNQYCESVNLEPMNYCVGACGGHEMSRVSLVPGDTYYHDKECHCCSAASTTEREVNLVCGDSSTVTVYLSVITACSCEECGQQGNIT